MKNIAVCTVTAALRAGKAQQLLFGLWKLRRAKPDPKGAGQRLSPCYRTCSAILHQCGTVCELHTGRSENFTAQISLRLSYSTCHRKQTLYNLVFVMSSLHHKGPVTSLTTSWASCHPHHLLTQKYTLSHWIIRYTVSVILFTIFTVYQWCWAK